MKKLSNILLGGITLLGTYLVSEGLITGEQLGDLQSVIGLSLAGGGVSIALIIAIISAIPKQLVTEGYKKAVSTYGQVKVDNVLTNFDNVVSMLEAVSGKLDSVTTELGTLQAKLDEASEIRTNILNG